MLPELVEIAHGAGGKKMDEMLEIVMKNIPVHLHKVAVPAALAALSVGNQVK